MKLDEELRLRCGDVLLVGGTFSMRGAKLILKNGTEFPVDLSLTIGRKGVTFSKVRISDSVKNRNVTA